MLPQVLEAIKAYSLVYVQLYLEGYRDFRATGTSEAFPIAGPSAVAVPDIHKKRLALQTALEKWRGDIAGLRDKFAFCPGPPGAVKCP